MARTNRNPLVWALAIALLLYVGNLAYSQHWFGWNAPDTSVDATESKGTTEPNPNCFNAKGYLTECYQDPETGLWRFNDDRSDASSDPAPEGRAGNPDPTTAPEGNGNNGSGESADKGCDSLPATIENMPNWLAAHFGGEARQWKQTTDQATGRKICEWEFLAETRALGVGPLAVFGYGTAQNAAEAFGTVSYGVQNLAGDTWLAGYLCGAGDYTIAQLGKKDATSIDTARWRPAACGSQETAARTPQR